MSQKPGIIGVVAQLGVCFSCVAIAWVAMDFTGFQGTSLVIILISLTLSAISGWSIVMDFKKFSSTDQSPMPRSKIASTLFGAPPLSLALYLASYLVLTPSGKYAPFLAEMDRITADA